MNVYARINIAINEENGTFALVNYRHTGKTSYMWGYGWILEMGPQWFEEFAPDPMVSLEEIPEWATKTALAVQQND